MELMKKTYHLDVLRISLQGLGGGASAVLAVEIEGDEVFEEAMPLSELGLPPDLEPCKSTQAEPSFRIPPSLVADLRSIAGERDDPARPLWIQLFLPHGHLAVVPWERLLQPSIEAPLLRLPYYAVPPVAPDDTLDVVVCASAPVAKGAWPTNELVERTVRLIVDNVSRRLTVHVFVDGRTFPDLHHLRREGSDVTVVLHDPQTVGVSRDREGKLSSPWLQWICAALQGNAADAVHFICPGYYTFDQGCLAFAEHPLVNEDRNRARFVMADELAAFLRLTGSWSVHLTSPTTDIWRIGLRLLADNLAQQRPGSVLLQDDPAGDAEAAEVFNLLYGHANHRPPRTGDFALYCHPGLVEESSRWDELKTAQPGVGRALEELTLASGGTLRGLTGGDRTPTWLASSQRYLEQCAGEVLDEQQPDWSHLDVEHGIEEIQSRRGVERSGLAGVRELKELPAAKLGAADALAFLRETIQSEAGPEVQW